MRPRYDGPGLEWRESSGPGEGRELTSPELAKALTSKTTFTQKEWDTFGICDLRDDDFVKIGDRYLKPAAEASLFFPVDLIAKPDLPSLLSLSLGPFFFGH